MERTVTEKRMYSQRVKNIPVMRSCFYFCTYCAFQKFQKISKREMCRAGVNHTHLEVLERTPPKTKPGKFLTIGLSGDVAFCSHDDLVKISSYCAGWSDRTFLVQSKNPAVFLEHYWSENVILGTTIETNREHIWDVSDPLKIRYDYQDLSSAPLPEKRYEAMVQLTCRKAVTIEPILSFNEDIMMQWIQDIKPEFVYVGFNSNQKLKLPEPSLAKTMELIKHLREAGIEIREKSLRKGWWE